MDAVAPKKESRSTEFVTEGTQEQAAPKPVREHAS